MPRSLRQRETCVVRKISSEFLPGHKGSSDVKQRYVAWISVENDNVYEFIQSGEKHVPMSTVQAKDVDRKLAFHNVTVNDTPKIEKWIGAERIEWRRRCSGSSTRHTAISRQLWTGRTKGQRIMTVQYKSRGRPFDIIFTDPLPVCFE